MGFALEENEEFPAAVTRIAVEQIDLALGHLRLPSEDLDRSVHATRQSLKRIRALLMLVRNELGDEVFEQEWACYRNIGRLLAGGRDAAVVVETLDSLVRRFSSELAAGAFASERRFLAAGRDRQLRVMIEEERALERAAEILADARARAATWQVKHAGFKALGGGLRRTYRTGREGLRAVVRHPSPTNFHEWRKPVKMLWHQVQILTPVWPATLNAYAQELQALSDRLNENHDLHVLLHVGLRSEVETRPYGGQTLASLVARRCRQLEAEGLRLGGRLYYERPHCFTARLRHYWRLWQREKTALRPADESVERREVCGVRRSSVPVTVA